LNHWNTSQVSNMSFMFKDTIFNQPLYNWDVSNVNTMESMFEGNLYFNLIVVSMGSFL